MGDASETKATTCLVVYVSISRSLGVTVPSVKSENDLHQLTGVTVISRWKPIRLIDPATPEQVQTVLEQAAEWLTSKTREKLIADAVKWSAELDS